MAYDMAKSIQEYADTSTTEDPVFLAALECGVMAADSVDWHRPHSAGCTCEDCMLWESVVELAKACGYVEKRS